MKDNLSIPVLLISDTTAGYREIPSKIVSACKTHFRVVCDGINPRTGGCLYVPRSNWKSYLKLIK